MKIAFVTVVYPSALKFWEEFYESIANQTFHGFDFIVGNDGCEPEYFNNYNVIVENVSGSIIENRLAVINYLIKNNYDWVIFGDCDDFFDLNRIEKINTLMGKYDLIANEIIPVKNGKIGNKIFSEKLGSFSEIDLSFIRDKNIFGLSNVACKVEYLKGISLNNNLIAADWTLFSKVMLNGAKACFTNNTSTYYRQWEANIIGIQDQSIQKIITGIKTKYFHYMSMYEMDKSYQYELSWIEKYYNMLLDDNIDNYCDSILKSKPNAVFWWENIKKQRVKI